MPKIIASAESRNSGGKFATHVQVRQHCFLADEPVDYGGNDLGPAPGDYLCAALASCTAITIRMYAERKQWSVTDINVTVNLVKGADTLSGQNTFFCSVKFGGTLSEEQHKRLLEIAKACPIHRLLTKQSDVVTVAAEASAKEPYL